MRSAAFAFLVHVRAWIIGAGAALAVAGAVAGCGGGSSSFDKNKVLDTERVERAIEQSIVEKRKLTAMVTCPSGVEKKKGLKFRCTAAYKGGTTTFLVTQDDDKGAVHYIGLKG
ncbi:MAG: hypothetical protein QOI65_1812 [Thermoleophilaceae bacterium]|nr:hypothetical protein [Thermoleophilaceae bacterium]